VNKGQAQSATTTGEIQTAVNTLIDTSMKRLHQGGIIIADSSETRRVDRGQAQSATTTGEVQKAVNTLIDTSMKQLHQGGIIITASCETRS
jgi:23S rRNA G2069 N7-methylase RlmK/C1962 C5-methylase RlmI